MDLPAAVIDTAGALRQAVRGDGPVLLDPYVVEALLRALPTESLALCDLDVRAQRIRDAAELIDFEYEEEPFDQFWVHFWGSLTCCYTEIGEHLRREVMMTSDFYTDRQWHSTGMYTEILGPVGVDSELVIPLPAQPGIARRLIFARVPGRPFGGRERSTAVLLQPHISEALRQHARASAVRLLTARQLELLQLVAAGHDNTAIARQLGLSRLTVRKHLENTFARLGVSSRTAAAARAFPDTTWA